MRRKEIIEGNEISAVYEFVLGGYPQKVMIEGKEKSLPVVLTLHGGPGMPVPFSVGCRGMFPAFTDHFLMVCWDQLGCGINDREIDDSFSIASFVQMTIDLIRELKRIFRDNKIYLFATSWGSILSAKVVEQCPELVDGAVVIGQIVKKIFFNDEVMEGFSRAGVPEGKIAVIRNADAEHFSPKDLQLISSCLRKYTDAYRNRSGRQPAMGNIVWGLLTSPDYSFRDFKAVMRNGYRKNNSLWKEILRLDLSGALREVRVPYLILQGDTDLVTPTKYVKELAETADNSCLQYRVVAQTGHWPGSTMMEELHRELLELTAP